LLIDLGVGSVVFTFGTWLKYASLGMSLYKLLLFIGCGVFWNQKIIIVLGYA
jgi:hypothetical protein